MYIYLFIVVVDVVVLLLDIYLAIVAFEVMSQ